MSSNRATILFGTVLILAIHTSSGCKRADPPGEKSASNNSTAPEAGDARTAPQRTERQGERDAMVKRQIAARGVRDSAVLDAMRRVPRHWFVPKSLKSRAYDDRPLPIGAGQTISQPYIVALMTEALHLKADSRVLEVGTGSGYQAAVLAEITPHVFTIEIVEPLGRQAMATFERHGYTTIKAKIGDGYAGWDEHAPFDAVIVTCAPDHVPPKLIEQLKEGGRMCIPVGSQRRVQSLHLITKLADGKLDTDNLIPVRFVPMTGDAQVKPKP